jgi:hypothetical protein
VNWNVSNLNKINKNGQIRFLTLLTYVQVSENQSSKAGVDGGTQI